jgi:acetoin utilization deacetylase AcuC-like enzyme
LNTALYYSPTFLEHDPGPDHPETPARLKSIITELSQSGVLESDKCAYFEPKPAKREDLELVHETEYIALVEKTCAAGGGSLDLGDTIVSPKSYAAATLAAGALIDALDTVIHEKARNAFALVRPPGHHAGAYYALGFCLFNNIAVGASYLVNRLNYKRILIIDVDTHHGNGTQEIFYDTDKVLYISLHEDSSGFPGTGFTDEIGVGKGLGYTVNIPLPFKTNDAIYQKAFDEIAIPIAHQYMPQFILISAGFDGHYADPVGDLSLSIRTYDETFTKIVALANQLCDGRLVATLEGGYSLHFLGKMVTSAIARMAHVSYRVDDSSPASHPRTIRKAEEIINNVKRIHSSFWKL